MWRWLFAFQQRFEYESRPANRKAETGPGGCLPGDGTVVCPDYDRVHGSFEKRPEGDSWLPSSFREICVGLQTVAETSPVFARSSECIHWDGRPILWK
ncbi:hypothetical protein HNY73_004858 [Argiope bruennichi]|uniref:Uncharacterized protein n=1 Tax=Argiope bruennichi TaxID=94029 RepID=A0A8T0FUY3_ARGBR|nr:hypothetical protein HNY73_004858 [Argiope bruennichi]